MARSRYGMRSIMWTAVLYVAVLCGFAAPVAECRIRVVLQHEQDEVSAMAQPTASISGVGGSGHAMPLLGSINRSLQSDGVLAFLCLPFRGTIGIPTDQLLSSKLSTGQVILQITSTRHVLFTLLFMEECTSDIRDGVSV